MNTQALRSLIEALKDVTRQLEHLLEEERLAAEDFKTADWLEDAP